MRRGFRLIEPGALTMRLTRAKTAPALVAEHARHGNAFDAVHYSTFWHRLGRLAGGGLRECDLVAPREATVSAIGAMRARNLANTAHGLAHASLRNEPPWDVLWRTLHGRLLRMAPRLKPQELANAAWALARAGDTPRPLFDALAEVSEEKLPAFNGQDVGNVAWAFATARQPAPALFDAIGAEVAKAARLEDFSAQEMSNTAWAFATRRHDAPHLFEAIAEEAACTRAFLARAATLGSDASSLPLLPGPPAPRRARAAVGR
jgi:hypothetical protein